LDEPLEVSSFSRLLIVGIANLKREGATGRKHPGLIQALFEKVRVAKVL
jgi:hypothetical protein